MLLPLHPLLQAAKRHCRLLLHTRYCNNDSIALALLTALSFVFRLYGIGNDNRVVWDETHFGRFASNYLTHTFYLDVHPPLGKLFLTLMFWLLGYSGSFSFASGQVYPDDLPFVQMRCIQAAIGSLLVPATFYMCRSLEIPLDSAWLAASFVALDNALIGISRILVLDTMLLFANSLTVIAFARVMPADFGRPALHLSRFACLGASIGVVCSTKFVGVFTAAVIDVYILTQVLRALVNTKPLGIAHTMEILLVYAGTLVVLPGLLYLTFFWIHFLLLQNYTPHADNMGSEYSVSLNGSALRIQPAHIYDSSFVTVRTAAYPFEYLYNKKHADRPEAVWLSTSRIFAVENYLKIKLLDNSSSIIVDGSIVSLQAPRTTRFISVFSHSRMSSGGSMLVGFAGQNKNNSQATRAGVATNNWKIKETTNNTNLHGIMPIASRFRLVSPENGDCELFINRCSKPSMTTESSPPLAKNFIECVYETGTEWTIEHQLPADIKPVVDISPYVAKPGLLKSTVSYNRLMYEINSMLKSDPDQYIRVESVPSSWPFLNRPMHLVGWADDEQPKYMLVGNILLWRISGIVCIFVHPVLLGLHWIIKRRSGGRMLLLHPRDSWKESALWSLWAAHYLVFFGMSRVTYLHHYLPALYFALVLTALYIRKLSGIISSLMTEPASTLDHKRWLYSTQNVLAVFVFIVAGITFILTPITYGTSDPCSYTRFRLFPSIRRQICS